MSVAVKCPGCDLTVPTTAGYIEAHVVPVERKPPYLPEDPAAMRPATVRLCSGSGRRIGSQ